MGTTQITDKLIGTCALSWSKRTDRVAGQNSDAIGRQCLTSLHRLPPTGAVLICLPLTIRQRSASPLGVLALVRDAAP